MQEPAWHKHNERSLSSPFRYINVKLYSLIGAFAKVATKKS